MSKFNLSKAAPTAFLATTNADRARAFYEDVLGLSLYADEHFALVYQLDGVELRLSKVPAFTPLPFTVFDWQVRDIHEARQALANKGVSFLHFDGMDQDEHGIWSSPDGAALIVWFKDPDGNVLSLSQRKP